MSLELVHADSFLSLALFSPRPQAADESTLTAPAAN